MTVELRHVIYGTIKQKDYNYNIRNLLEYDIQVCISKEKNMYT